MIDSMAGYSKRSLVQKLGIKEGFRIALVNPPDNYSATLGPLPKGVVVTGPRAMRRAASLDFIHLFSQERSDLEKRLSMLKQSMSPMAALWVSWPKGSSGVQTDLNENRVREIALKNGLVDVKVCAVDETWSGLKLVYRRRDRP